MPLINHLFSIGSIRKAICKSWYPYLTRTLKPAKYTALDLNPAGIAFCKKRHQVEGLEFVRGDAENLPFPDNSFDAVINGFRKP